MFASLSLSLSLLLLASLGCQAMPNPGSGPTGKDRRDQPLPGLLDIQKYLKELKHMIKHIPTSSEDSERQAEAKRKQMDLIRQQVYEALAPVESPRRGLDDWQLQRPSGKAGQAKPPRPCWGNLLTCLQAGIPSQFHQSSFGAPALRLPCHGHHCDPKVQAKPHRSPTYTTARPSGGIYHHNNPCKNNQSGCHHNRILPTYAPIRFNKLPTRRILTTTSRDSTISNVEKKQQSSTTPSQKVFTLPEKLYNLAFNPSTTPSVINTVKPKNSLDDWIKLENEILGITVGKQFDIGLKTEASVLNKDSSVTGITTQPHSVKNENVSTAKTIMTGSFPSSDSDTTIQPSYMSKHPSSQSTVLPSITFISGRPLTKSEGDFTTSLTFKEPTTVTQRTSFDEASLTTGVSTSIIRPQESKAEPYVPSDHLSHVLTISSASEYTTLRGEIRQDFLTTQVSLFDSPPPKQNVKPNDPVSPSSDVSPNLEYTTLRTVLNEVLMTTQINPMSGEHQGSESETLPDVDHLSPEPTISPTSEYTTRRAHDDDLWTTQISPIYTKPDLDSTVKLIQPVDNFSADSFISPTVEISTLKLDEVLQTTHISPLESAHQETEAKTNVDGDKLSSHTTVSAASEYTSLRAALGEDTLTTQINLLDTKPDQDSKTEPKLKHFTTDPFISYAAEYSTLRMELDDVLTTTQLISKGIDQDETFSVNTNLHIGSPIGSTYPTSKYPIIDDSLRVASPTIWKTEDSTITVGVNKEGVSKPIDIESTKLILADEDSQSSEATTSSENISRRGPITYFVTKMTDVDSFTPITDVSGRTDGDTEQTTAILRVVESDTRTIELPSETTTLQFESKEHIFEKGTTISNDDLTTNVPVQESITDDLPFRQDQTLDHISNGKQRSTYPDLENERGFRGGIWKFTSELENYDYNFANDAEAVPTSNDEITLGHRLKRAVASERQLEPHNMEAFISHSSLSFTTKNNSITFNASNIVELWPIILEGFKNNAFAEEDKQDIRSIYDGQMKSLLGEDALDEVTEPELLGDETTRTEGDEEDYEYDDSAEEEIREKRSRKTFNLGKEFAVRLTESLRNNFTTSSIRTSRIKRSTGGQPVSEAAAILALLSEGGGAVQLDRADDEDDDDYEYYGYEDDDEYEDQYGDVGDDYDDNPSFKELILLANRHRKRKEVNS